MLINLKLGSMAHEPGWMIDTALPSLHVGRYLEHEDGKKFHGLTRTETVEQVLECMEAREQSSSNFLHTYTRNPPNLDK